MAFFSLFTGSMREVFVRRNLSLELMFMDRIESFSLILNEMMIHYKQTKKKIELHFFQLSTYVLMIVSLDVSKMLINGLQAHIITNRDPFFVNSISFVLSISIFLTN